MNEESEIPDRDTLASEYFERLPFDPYPVQENTYWIFSQQGVLVCAHWNR